MLKVTIAATAINEITIVDIFKILFVLSIIHLHTKIMFSYNCYKWSTSNPAVRVFEIKGGNTIRYGGGLYLGADLFISKNISMGAEFDLFAYGSYITEEVGVGETWKLEKVYVAERKMTPVCTGFDIAPTGFFNINIYV